MRITAVLVLIALLITQSAYLPAAGLASSITLTANPNTIVADGKSATMITVEVRDVGGSTVPDGTLISFSTDSGTIQSTVGTVAGVARVRFTSSAIPGTATIAAWVTTGGAIGQLKVDMIAPGSEMSRESFVTISSARYLAYDPDKMIIDGAGGVKINHRGLAITADEAQIDVQNGIVRCRMASGSEPIHLTRGKKTFNASVLYYSLRDTKGDAMIDDSSGKVRRVSFRASDLESQPDDSYVPANHFDFTDVSESQLLVKASSIILRPGQELRIRKAKVFVDGKKMLSMPMHVVPVGGVTNEVSRYIGWSATGLRVDLPFFYSLSANGTGSVRLRRGQPAGWGYYSGDQGWALDVVQDYTTPSGGDGGVMLNRITTGDWGAQWHHTQELLSGGQVYSYIDFPAHRDLFGTTSISRPVGNLNLGANMYASKAEGQALGYSSDLYAQTNPKPIAGGIANYMIRGTTAFSSGTNTGVGTSGTGLQMQFSGHPVKFSKTTSLSTSLTLGQSWGSKYAGTSVLGTASMMHRIGSAGGAGLSYTYTSNDGSLGMYGQHRLSGNLSLNASRRWQANLSGTYTLDKPMSTCFADLSYVPLRGWRLSLLQTFTSNEVSTLLPGATVATINRFNYSDTELGLGRMIADHEVMLVWSKSQHKLRVDFAAARF